MHNFGIGGVFAVPAGSNPTPAQAGTVQEVSVDFSFDTKELRGQKSGAVASARTALKVTGKVKWAKFFGRQINDMFVNGTLTTGATLMALDEAGTPATLTVLVAQSATFLQDMGVKYAATGLPLQRVASAPALGQYSVVETGAGKGTYTFNVADTGAMKFCYLYTSTTGSTINMANALMGTQPQLTMFLHQKFNGKQTNLKLFSVSFNKLTWPCKNEDFVVLESDFTAYADAGDNIAEFYMEDNS